MDHHDVEIMMRDEYTDVLYHPTNLNVRYECTPEFQGLFTVKMSSNEYRKFTRKFFEPHLVEHFSFLLQMIGDHKTLLHMNINCEHSEVLLKRLKYIVSSKINVHEIMFRRLKLKLSQRTLKNIKSFMRKAKILNIDEEFDDMKLIRKICVHNRSIDKISFNFHHCYHYDTDEEIKSLRSKFDVMKLVRNAELHIEYTYGDNFNFLYFLLDLIENGDLCVMFFRYNTTIFKRNLFHVRTLIQSYNEKFARKNSLYNTSRIEEIFDALPTKFGLSPVISFAFLYNVSEYM